MKVAVLGAGVVGVASAWYLAEAGHEVTVVDRQAGAGLETSFANGGQISAGHAEPWAKPSALPRILSWLGKEDAPLLYRPRADWRQWAWGFGFALECLPGRFERNCRELAGLALYSRDCLAELRGRTGLAYDALTRGILEFCTERAEFEALARHAESMRRVGIEREILDAAQCVALEPALSDSAARVAGGLYAPKDESGDAFAFTRELARLAQARGVTFRYGQPIEALEVAGSRVRTVRLQGGEALPADAYVVALGSYSAPLLAPAGIRIPVYPLKGYSITFELAPEDAAVAPSVSLTDEAHKIVVTRLGERLRAAGTAELDGYDASVNAVRCDAIERRVRELFPRLSRGRPALHWAGLRPATPSNVPVIGRTRLSNLWLNTGHGTLGWTLACGSGRALADLMSGRRPAVAFRFA